MLQNCNLPSDVLEKILLKLPTKSLLRCRSVCKSWYAFLNSNRFIQMHLRQPVPKKLILQSYDSDESFLSICSENGMYDVSVLPSNFDYKVTLQDSCNGLVCLSVDYGHSHIILWNPATGKHRNIGVPHSFTDYLTYVGLGFAPATDDYKIIWIIPPSAIETSENSVEAKLWVYSLRSDSWKMVEILPYAYYLWPPTSVNGCMHWITCSQTSEDRILAFDLCSESLQYLALPLDFHSSIDNSIALAVINGSLCLVISLEVDRTMNRHFEVWVMTEYGVEDSWTRNYVVGPFSYISRPVGSWRDSNKLLFLDFVENDVLLSYDVVTDVMDFVCSGFNSLTPLNYIESFESVDGRTLAPETASPVEPAV